jgi:transposase
MSEDRSRAPEDVPDASQAAAAPLVDTPEPTRLTVGALYGQDAALQRKRYVVERTLGWRKGFRRVRYRVDRTAASFHAAVY